MRNKAVIRLHENTKTEMFERFLRETPLTGLPSAFLRDMRTVASKVGVGEELIRHRFQQALPPSIAVNTEIDERKFSWRVDIIHPVQIVTNQRRGQNDSNHRQTKTTSRKNVGLTPIFINQQPKVCRSHLFFDKKSKTCRSWCHWPDKSGLTTQYCPSSPNNDTRKQHDIFHSNDPGQHENKFFFCRHGSSHFNNSSVMLGKESCVELVVCQINIGQWPMELRFRLKVNSKPSL